MKKDEVLSIVKELFELGNKKEAEELLAKFDSLIEVVGDKLENDKKATIGKFVSVEKKFVEAKHSDTRTGRNPRTGEPIQIPAKDTPAHEEVRIKGTKKLNEK